MRPEKQKKKHSVYRGRKSIVTQTCTLYNRGEQHTASGFTPVSQEQESETIMSTGSPKQASRSQVIVFLIVSCPGWLSLYP